MTENTEQEKPAKKKLPKTAVNKTLLSLSPRGSAGQNKMNSE